QVSMDQVQWVVTAYLLVITASLIFFGRLGDKVGSHKIYTYGFLLFSLGSLGCSLARVLPILVAARMFQGVGASMMMATGIGIVSNTFPEGERGKALGLTGTIVALGTMIGPGLGGLILAKFAWPWIFLINVPIGLLGFVLGRRYLPAQVVNPDIRSFDVRGTLLLAATVATLLIALSSTPSINFLLLLAAGLLLGGFLFWERQAASPLLDFALFKVKPFLHGNWAAIVVYFTQTSVFFLLPFYMELIMGFSPADSGLMMTITPVSMAIVAPLSGYLSDKIGSNRLITGSFLTLTISYLLLSTLGTGQPKLMIAAGLICLGIGMGMFGSPNTSSMLGSIPHEKAGYGGGFIATNRNLSFSLGITCAVGLFSWVLDKSQPLLPYQLAYIQASHLIYLSTAAVSGAACLLWILVQFRSD
ncbi:MAG: MFS transporter, partial [Firmicutes bacterium]|nr:MFS transporter [Bacillota bacterium]